MRNSRTQQVIRTVLAIVIPFANALPSFAQDGGPDHAQAERPSEVKLQKDASVVILIDTGSLVVSGSPNDVLVAKATFGANGETAPVVVSRDEQTGMLTVSVDKRHARGDVHLDVKVPKIALLRNITAKSADVSITDVPHSISIRTGSGTVTCRRGGDLEVISGSGDIDAEDYSGSASLSTGSGNIRARRTGGVTALTGSGDVTAAEINGECNIEDRSGTVRVNDVTGGLVVKALSGDVLAEAVGGNAVLSLTSGNVTVRRAGANVSIYALSGDATVECAKGNVEATNASGNITLVGVDGNVEVQTASGDLSFTGVLKPNGRYRMKTTSGDTVMTIQPNPPGFTLSLSSYSGEMETAFPIDVSDPVRPGPINRKLVGRRGEGGADIVLTSFSGTARLLKGENSNSTCGEQK